MSDNSDLGGYGPTTPVASTRATVARVGRSRLGNSLAGPSKPASGTGRTKKAVDPPSDTSANEVIDVDEEEDGLMPATEPTRKASRKKAAREPSVVNERPSTKGKGKEKATQLRTKKRADATRAEVEVIEEEEEEEESVATDIARAINASNSKKGGDKLQEERWRKRYEELEKRYQDVSSQLERLHRIRETEAEQLLREKTEQYEVRLTALERLNAELTSNLARVEPLSRSGKTSVLHLLTREAADAENRQIQQEAIQWKNLAEGKDGIIEEKNRIIEEMTHREKELQFELDIERKRAASMKPERPPSASRGRGGVLGADNPKHAELVRIYEDSTNLLITNLRSQPSPYFNLDDWTMTCIFTYMSDTNDHKSVNFNLSACWQAEDPDRPVTAQRDLIRMMYYTPLELDKEPQDFVANLGYLNAPFSFKRDQMPLFLRTLYSTINEALTGGGESGSEGASMMEDVEVIE